MLFISWSVFYAESEENSASPSCILTFQDIVSCLDTPQGGGAVDVVYNGICFQQGFTCKKVLIFVDKSR